MPMTPQQGKTHIQAPDLFFPLHHEQILCALRICSSGGGGGHGLLHRTAMGSGRKRFHLMPREELRGTYNTGCWGQGEACLVHLGMNTEKEGRREVPLRRGQKPDDQGGPLLCSILTTPASQITLQEKDTDVHKKRQAHTLARAHTHTLTQKQ